MMMMMMGQQCLRYGVVPLGHCSSAQDKKFLIQWITLNSTLGRNKQCSSFGRSDHLKKFLKYGRKNVIMQSQESERSGAVCVTSGDQDQEENRDSVAIAQVGNTQGRIAVLRASKSAAIGVEEQSEPLETYMTLPASQYSVLDAKRIERVDEDTFRCYVGGFHFMNFHVDPVLTLSVIVEERGPTVRLLDTTLQGSKVVEEANNRFNATMVNIVRWREGGEYGKEICSETSLEVTLELPGWFLLPPSVVENSGSKIMQKVLNKAVPRFLEQLKNDYETWATGGSRTIGLED